MQHQQEQQSTVSLVYIYYSRHTAHAQYSQQESSAVAASTPVHACTALHTPVLRECMYVC
jgi:hypothetical protein